LLVTSGLALLGLEPTLVVLLSLLFVAILAKAAVVWFAMMRVRFTVIWIMRDLRLRLVRALLGARLTLFSKERSGEWANAVAQEVNASGAAYREACEIAAAVFPISAYVLLATLISWQTSLFAVLSGAVLLAALRGFVGMARTSGSDQTLLMRQLAGLFVDVVGGLKPLKAMARERLVEPLLEKPILELDAASRRGSYANENTRFFQEPTLTLLLAVGVYVLFEFQGLPLSTIVVLAFMFYRIIQHLNTLQVRYQVLVVGEASFWSVIGRIEQAESARERPHGGVPPGRLKSELRLAGVSFAYDDGPAILDDLCLDIQAGTFVAIVGGSGSGKTTLVDLIAGLHTPTSGRILVDGVDLEELDLGAWRGQIGYVPQEMLLLNDSVRHNVTLGSAGITDTDVERALRLAGAWDFVRAHPDGLDAPVGERGTRLSGGQRQRIAIARALVMRPSVLILDEVTTALDPATEAAICQTLSGLRGEMTIISISHQPAMRAVADETWTIAAGRLSEHLPSGADSHAL
jgi:ATP-binding cassette subfamily C protein